MKENIALLNLAMAAQQKQADQSTSLLCKAYRMNCEPKMKYIEARRQKRSGFTRGLIKAGEKLLDGSPGGFLVEMVKT